MDEGFTLWKIIRKEYELPVFRGENGNHLFVHILVLSGELKAEWTGILYPLTKNSFADFIDGRSLEIRDISEDIQAYVLFFTAPFIASLMKNTAPFPPSYILHTKAWPVSVLSSEVTERIQKRMNYIVESLKDESHHFYTEMMSCTLQIYMMDIANEFIRQENEGGAQMEVSRKHILFKQFTGLLIAHIREEQIGRASCRERV